MREPVREGAARARGQGGLPGRRRGGAGPEDRPGAAGVVGWHPAARARGRPAAGVRSAQVDGRAVVEGSGVSSDGTVEDRDAAGRAWVLPCRQVGPDRTAASSPPSPPCTCAWRRWGPTVLHVVHSGTRPGTGRHRKHARPAMTNRSADLALERGPARHVGHPEWRPLVPRGTAQDTPRGRYRSVPSPDPACHHVARITVAGCDDHRVLGAAAPGESYRRPRCISHPVPGLWCLHAHGAAVGLQRTDSPSGRGPAQSPAPLPQSGRDRWQA
jgi:hypothetical protein